MGIRKKPYSPWISLLALVHAFTNTGFADEFTDCLKAPDRFFKKSEQEVACTTEYLMFKPKEDRSQGKKQRPEDHAVRIASFNLLKLGNGQPRFKKLDWIARLMNQWDLVTALEILPTKNEVRERNSSIDPLLDPLFVSSPLYQKELSISPEKLILQYEKPAYLALLEELQKWDPSWALLLSSKSSGSSASNQELVGFYYRGSLLKAIPNPHCPKERVACALEFDEMETALLSRSPFMAAFQTISDTNQMKWIQVGQHVRFNAPEIKEMYSYKGHPTLVSKAVDLLLPKSLGKLGFEDRARFAGVKIIVDRLGEWTRSRPEMPFLFAGDFNLENTPNDSVNQATWKHTLSQLPGAIIAVNEKTSISEKNGRVSEYDHFIFQKDAFPMCDAEGAAAFDFLKLENFARLITAPGESIPTHAAQIRKRMQLRLEEYQEQYEQTVSEWLDFSYDLSGSQKFPSHVKVKKSFSKATIAEFLDEFERRLEEHVEDLYPDSDEPEDSVLPYQIHRQLLSDHLPITLECSEN